MAEGGGEFVGEADPRGTPGNEGQDGDEKYGGLRSLFSTPLRAYREATTRLSGTVRSFLIQPCACNIYYYACSINEMIALPLPCPGPCPSPAKERELARLGCDEVRGEARGVANC